MHACNIYFVMPLFSFLGTYGKNCTGTEKMRFNSQEGPNQRQRRLRGVKMRENAVRLRKLSHSCVSVKNGNMTTKFLEGNEGLLLLEPRISMASNGQFSTISSHPVFFHRIWDDRTVARTIECQLIARLIECVVECRMAWKTTWAEFARESARAIFWDQSTAGKEVLLTDVSIKREANDASGCLII